MSHFDMKQFFQHIILCLVLLLALSACTADPGTPPQPGMTYECEWETKTSYKRVKQNGKWTTKLVKDRIWECEWEND